MEEKPNNPFLEGVIAKPELREYENNCRSKSSEPEPLSSKKKSNYPPVFSVDLTEKISGSRKNIVKTPEWRIDSDQPPIKTTTNLHYNLFRKHMRLEVIESRINDGTDEINIHPAVSSDIENKGEDLILSKAELKLKANYRFHKEEKKIPKFWLPRVWDNTKTIMSSEESDKLLGEILKIQEKIPIDLFDQNISDSSEEEVIRKKRRRRKNGQSVWVDVSMLDFETENSDENTDWEELDL